MSKETDETGTVTPPPAPQAPQGGAAPDSGRPQIRIDPAMVAETLQRKNAQLMSQIVYDNAVLETALETAHRRISELEAQNEGLKKALAA